LWILNVVCCISSESVKTIHPLNQPMYYAAAVPCFLAAVIFTNRLHINLHVAQFRTLSDLMIKGKLHQFKKNCFSAEPTTYNIRTKLQTKHGNNNMRYLQPEDLQQNKKTNTVQQVQICLQQTTFTLTWTSLQTVKSSTVAAGKTSGKTHHTLY